MAEWQWHQLTHTQIICTMLQTDNHVNISSIKFLQARCSSWRLTNSVKALKAQTEDGWMHKQNYENIYCTCTQCITVKTRHRASTSMYSLTFCVRVMSPECHHWKPAIQAAAVMLRTPAVDGQSPASQPRPLAIYGAQCSERLRHMLVKNVSNARAPRVN